MPANKKLARALPRALRIPRNGRDAIKRARPRLLDPLAAFFAAPVMPESTSQV
jgi:hypothetical protein